MKVMGLFLKHPASFFQVSSIKNRNDYKRIEVFDSNWNKLATLYV